MMLIHSFYRAYFLRIRIFIKCDALCCKVLTGKSEIGGYTVDIRWSFIDEL